LHEPNEPSSSTLVVEMGSSTQVGEVVSSSQVVDTVIPYPRVAMTRWGSLGLASQVEGEREPPTSQNDSLGVDVAGVAGGGGERAPNES